MFSVEDSNKKIQKILPTEAIMDKNKILNML